jgi:hypothetical protein
MKTWNQKSENESSDWYLNPKVIDFQVISLIVSKIHLKHISLICWNSFTERPRWCVWFWNSLLKNLTKVHSRSDLWTKRK